MIRGKTNYKKIIKERFFPYRSNGKSFGIELFPGDYVIVADREGIIYCNGLENNVIKEFERRYNSKMISIDSEITYFEDFKFTAHGSQRILGKECVAPRKELEKITTESKRI